MLRIFACAMLWFCSGCVVGPFEHQIQREPNADKNSASSPAFVHDENRPGRPVVAVYLSGPKVTDADIKSLVDLKELKTLDLRNTSVTDAGLKDLARLTQLRELYLVGTKVTDAGLKDVANLKQLEKLYLIGARITDAGVKTLLALNQLQELNVSDTMVTPAGRRQLEEALPGCQIVR